MQQQSQSQEQRHLGIVRLGPMPREHHRKVCVWESWWPIEIDPYKRYRVEYTMMTTTTVLGTLPFSYRGERPQLGDEPQQEPQPQQQED
mmetsp:Transcript_130025/g.363970  ORF Transcript_130025/g.363970 Transcript_130025/m.363970 type:complete len:89 (-) Transcript_130025:538-804(-)